jgi:GntR family transcriptional regulator
MSELLNSLKSDWQSGLHGAMSRVPLYHQLYSVLKAAILDGTIPYDAQMPTEQQLTGTFDISRITAKRAMDELAAEDLVSRFRGKGSHVTYQYTPRPVRGPLVGMLESLIEMSEHSIVRVVSIEKVVAPADIRDLLHVSDSDLVHKVIRVSSNEEGEPYAYYVSWTVGISKAYTKRKLESKTRLNLLRENGINLTKMEQVLSAQNAAGRVAAELSVQPGEALLSVRRLGSIENGVVVDVLDGLYNPKRYQYAMIMSLN